MKSSAAAAQYSSVLTMESVRPSDGGRYSCRPLSDSAMTLPEAEVNLHVVNGEFSTLSFWIAYFSRGGCVSLGSLRHPGQVSTQPPKGRFIFWVRAVVLKYIRAVCVFAFETRSWVL